MKTTVVALTVVLCFLATACIGSLARQAGSTLEIYVTDNVGEPIGNAEVRLSSPRAQIDSFTETEETGVYLVGDVPVDQYILQVSVPGFVTARRTIQIRESLQFSKIGLFVDDIGAHLFLDVSGRVLEPVPESLTWARLASIHGFDSYEARIDEDGSFSFSTLPLNGPYMLTIVSGTRLCSSSVFDPAELRAEIAVTLNDGCR